MAGALNVLVMCRGVVPVVRERPFRPAGLRGWPPQVWGFSGPRGMQNKKSSALNLWTTGVLRRVEPQGLSFTGYKGAI